ncbi:MAG: hypothetical protein ACREJB_09175, partial [Planctomycetaceae bacterium]
MAHAYTPGLKVSRRMRHRARRVLPIAGEVLVKAGERVAARDVVAQTHMPGDVLPINLANQLSIPAGDVPGCLLKTEGERIEAGEIIARTPGIFGLFKSEYKAKVSGTLESVSGVTGQLIVRGEPLPVRVLAYLPGEVVEVIPREGVVIEEEVTYIQGIFGIGGETFGPVRLACADHTEDLTAELIRPSMQGCVVVGGARMTGDAVRRGIEVGAAAVVSGGMDDQDLKEILGYDLGVAVTGSEHVGITLIITEGFGDIAMAERTFQLIKEREGQEASVNGATQIRAGVMRPEIVIPLGDADAAENVAAPDAGGLLQVGTPVRVIRDPHFGLIGEV